MLPDPSPADTVAQLPPPLTLAEMLRARTPRLYATPAIAVLQVAVFCVMSLVTLEAFFSSSTQIQWGGQFAPRIAAGEWWRLVTPMLLHGNVLHVAFNTLLLWQLGGYVERLLGPLVFVIVYVLCGVVASVVSLQLHDSNVVSVGASGAIFGLAGVLLSATLASGRQVGQHLGTMVGELRGSLISFIVYNAIAGAVLPVVDNAAHGGGLVGGLAIGWLVGRHSFEARPSPRMTVLPIALTLLLAAAEVHLVAGRRDVAMEAYRFEQVSAQARTALRAAVADVDAGRKTATQAGADLDRVVAPPLRDARERAARLARELEDRQAADARAWHAYVSTEAEVWQMRVLGLPRPMRHLLVMADYKERAARRTLDEALARR